MTLERKNFIWNMIGSAFYAFASMVLSFLVLRIIGKEQGGIFSFGFSTVGQQMFILAYFGIRPYQITDTSGEYSFGDYFLQRIVTCLIALAAGFVFLLWSGYGQEKMIIIFLLIAYKVIDGFADVYESEFQRNGCLYLTGQSNTFRTILSVGAFLTALVVTRQLELSCVVAVAAQLLGVLLFDVIRLHRMDGVVYRGHVSQVPKLFGSVWLLFVSTFLDFYVFSASKYAIDANLNDTASGYFNILFMPTQLINLAAGFIIRPFLTYLSEDWNAGDIRGFRKRLGRIGFVIAAFTAFGVCCALLLGTWALGILEMLLGPAYTGTLTQYHLPFVLIILGGGFYAILNLFYYALVIMRRQKTIFFNYLILTVLAAVLAPLAVRLYAIPGAVYAYVVLMALLAVVFGCSVVAGCCRARLASVQATGGSSERREK